MKKILILCLIVFLLAATFSMPKVDITGLFVKASSTIVNIARIVVKQILTTVAGLL
ncbi:MAG: hypothetical protein GTN36_06340 [Candidatus Aenigmarchaeota archaeon]|nr:hypothetical protein [Candidatus Aenigmarchaeota archaeon]